MKNLKNLGRALSKAEQKTINGGKRACTAGMPNYGCAANECCGTGGSCYPIGANECLVGPIKTW